MAEIYKFTNSTAKFKIFFKGELVDAYNDLVMVDIFDVTNDISIDPQIDPNDPLYEDLIAEKTLVDVGSYEVLIPYQLTDRDRKLKLRWHYYYNNTPFSQTTYLDIVTPYCNLSEALEDLNLGVDSSDPNYKTYHDLSMAEKYARKTIENYCNQSFNLYEDNQIAYGSGSDILSTPFKLNQLHKLYANDILLVDNLTSVNNWNYVPQISESGFGLRVDRSQSLDNTVYVANGMVPPSINDTAFGAFQKDVRYKIVGKFGWSEVPDNVEQACIQLIGDFFAKDNLWKTKYVKNIQTFDWQFEYQGDAFKGTGNLYVDQLLNPYVINGMVVI